MGAPHPVLLVPASSVSRPSPRPTSVVSVSELTDAPLRRTHPPSPPRLTSLLLTSPHLTSPHLDSFTSSRLNFSSSLNHLNKNSSQLITHHLSPLTSPLSPHLASQLTLTFPLPRCHRDEELVSYPPGRPGPGGGPGRPGPGGGEGGREGGHTPAPRVRAATAPARTSQTHTTLGRAWQILLSE